MPTSAAGCSRRAWWRCAMATRWPCSSAVTSTRGRTWPTCSSTAPRNCRRRSRCATPCRATSRANCRRSWPIAWPTPGGSSSMSTIGFPSSAATFSKRWPWSIATMPSPGSVSLSPEARLALHQQESQPTMQATARLAEAATRRQADRAQFGPGRRHSLHAAGTGRS